MKFLSSTVAVFASLALVGNNHPLHLAEGKEQTVTFAHGVAEKNHKKNTNKNATRNIMMPPKPTNTLTGVRRDLKVDLAMGHFPDDGAGVEFSAKEGESTGNHPKYPPGKKPSPTNAEFYSFSLNGLHPNQVEMGSPVPVARAAKSAATPPAASHGDQKASGLRRPAMSGKSPVIKEHPDTLDHPPSPHMTMDHPLHLHDGIVISPEKQHTATKDNKAVTKGDTMDMFSLQEESERSGGSVLDPDEVGDVFHVDGGEAGLGVTSTRTGVPSVIHPRVRGGLENNGLDHTGGKEILSHDSPPAFSMMSTMMTTGDSVVNGEPPKRSSINMVGADQSSTLEEGSGLSKREKNNVKDLSFLSPRLIMMLPKPTNTLKGIRRALKEVLSMEHFPNDGAGVEFSTKEGKSTGNHPKSPLGKKPSPTNAEFDWFSLNGLDPNQVGKGQADNHAMGSPVPVARAAKSAATPPAASHGDQKASGLRCPAMSGKSPVIKEHPDTLDHPPSPHMTMDHPLHLHDGIAVSSEKQHTVISNDEGVEKGDMLLDMFSLQEESERSGGSVLDPDKVGDVFHVDGGEAGPSATSARTVTSTRFNDSLLTISGVMSKEASRETNISQKDGMLGSGNAKHSKGDHMNNDHIFHPTQDKRGPYQFDPHVYPSVLGEHQHPFFTSHIPMLNVTTEAISSISKPTKNTLIPKLLPLTSHVDLEMPKFDLSTLPPKGQAYNNDHRRQLMESFSVVQLGKDLDGEALYDYFGRAVAISGDASRAIVGGTYNDGNGFNSGHARVFQYNGLDWVQLGADIDGESVDDYSGYSVDISHDGNTVIIGAPGNDGNGSYSGHAWIFKYLNDRWTQMGSDLDGEASGDQFGSAVAISGDASRAIIGASFNDGNGDRSGHARVFQYNGLDWEQLGADINGESAGDDSGISVDISHDGNTVIIGARHNHGNGYRSGHARIFKYLNDRWTQMGSNLDGEASNDQFGSAVAISGDASRAIIGARYNDGNESNSGHARVFQYNGLDWEQLGADIDGESAGDDSGFSVDISHDGNTVIIGAYGNDGNGSNSGHARIFEYLNDRWTQMGSNLDGEASGDKFGSAVAISGDASRAIVGGYGNDGNGSNSGHARVFEISPVTPNPTPAPTSNPTLSPSSTPSKTPSLEPSPTPTSSLINIGNDFFHPIGQFTGLDGDPLFGSSVTMSDDGRTIAFWGSFSNHTSYVDVFSVDSVKDLSWIQLGQRILTDVDNDLEHRPVVDLSLSGNGKILAVATTYVDSSSPSGIKVYQLVDDGSANAYWEKVGLDVAAGSLGHLPGLKVSLSRNGTVMAIGGRNFEHDGIGAPKDIGRAMIYHLSDDTNDWNLFGNVTGAAAEDKMGASVSITGDGDYVAVGATGFDNNAESVHSGYVKIFHITQNHTAFAENPHNFLVGEPIRGERKHDKSGFSVKLVKVSTSLLKVAVGAIHNDGEDGTKKDAGHVRVFAFDKATPNPTWNQIGKDMDGDAGATIDYPNFHGGDSLGFSLGMSLDGNRVGMGAPFSSDIRMAEYYAGSFKLFEYNPNINDWEQIVNDLIGEDGGHYGWSVDLSGDGKSIIIGGPASPEGKVEIWYQDEVSNAPSLQPSSKPSTTPSLQPSTQPTAIPSISPSVVPSLVPSSQPSTHPSAKPSVQPSSQPSTHPSILPSMPPSAKPSVQPSSQPSIHPSTLPSIKPSMLPSVIPSISPSSSPSDYPSASPSQINARTMRILSNFIGFQSLSNDETTKWCLQAKHRTPGSVLFVRPCDFSNPDISWKQLWYYQDQRIYLKKSSDLCINDEGKKLFLQQCVPNEGNDFHIDSHDTNNIYVKRLNSNRDLYFVVNDLKLFSRIHLSRKELANGSWDSWGLQFEDGSVMPSGVPSVMPSQSPVS